ncbi:5'-methylthioadenosine/adenosylhomocysteine nucleosidase [Brucepastera parasyntrophica]|uniref:5'-methylthioadenosine/adenosylhomocysteine nucleosidase n=1 Tax=Brucepastera parasyntrophica TaxID=2880008 RepID=UPI00210ABFAA|nr:5'-methylthioadenosine/adenosylhomocysteine nucleosidase [Brucepastera parasyntrophica]ULQ58833.1 5'-methylthioadenosine/adenosylhomocysteine nucleosidase [Brucepastera parasyntrophica]
MKLGIIGAEKQEVDLLVKALSGPEGAARKRKAGAFEFFEGNLRGCPAVVVLSGIGKVNAAICTQTLILNFNPDYIINTGSAGGLAAGLAVLDMIVSADAVQHDVDAVFFGYKPGQVPGTGSPFFTADAFLRKAALSAFGKVMDSESCRAHMRLPEGTSPKIIEGRIASGDVFVSAADTRNKIIDLFHPACVEMEGAAIAQVCSVNSVPFVILRCVSDLAGENANMSYESFSRFASDISAHVVMAIAEGLKEEQK